MATIVALNTQVTHRYVYELRYEFGQVFWDRSGRVAKQILSKFDDWDFDNIDINRCQLSCRTKNLAFGFGHEKLDLSQTQNADVETLIDLGDFCKIAEEATKLVVDSLELEFFPRIGFRVWYLYPTTDRAQADNRICELSIFRLSDKSDLAKGASETSFRLVTDRGDHMLRIAIGPFEQNVLLAPSVLRAAKVETKNLPKNQREAMIDKIRAKKIIEHYPHFGVLLDLDAYLEEPPIPTDISVSDFILKAAEDFERIKPEILMSQ